MLVCEIKRIDKFGKKFLEEEDSYKIIEKIIEKPLQKACKDFKNKNIETVMSSANKSNIMKNDDKIVRKGDLIQILKKHKLKSFYMVGKGYAWIMVNYNTLSDENRKIFFNLEKELGEEAIWFVKSNYVETMNSLRRKFKIKEIVETFDDRYAEEFRKKQLLLMYNNKYPRRAIFIRMPINKSTTIDEVEEYFSKITDKLIKQEEIS